MFSKVILFFSVLSVAIAGPIGSPAAPQEVNAQSCSADQTVSCCNSGSLLGLDCLTVPVLSVLGSATCQSNTVAACCQKDEQTGLINVSLDCTVIPVNV